MDENSKILDELTKKKDLEWFDFFCEILKSDIYKSTNEIIEILGTERAYPIKENRGSKFLEPNDSRFESIAINPDISNKNDDKEIEYIGLRGDNFSLNLKDIIFRFGNFILTPNNFDGGTQIFFYPISDEYKFNGLEIWVEQNNLKEQEIEFLNTNNIAFQFGNVLSKLRDGLHLYKN